MVDQELVPDWHQAFQAMERVAHQLSSELVKTSFEATLARMREDSMVLAIGSVENELFVMELDRDRYRRRAQELELEIELNQEGQGVNNAGAERSGDTGAGEVGGQTTGVQAAVDQGGPEGGNEAPGTPGNVSLLKVRDREH